MLEGILLSSVILIPLIFSSRIYDPYIPIKYNVLIFLGGLALFCLAFFKKNSSFRVSLLQLVCLIICLGVYLFHIFSSVSIFNEKSLVNYLCVFSIGSAVCAVMDEDLSSLQRISFVCSIPLTVVALIGLLQYSNFSFTFFPRGQGAISTLANINMVAQYLGLTLPLMIYLYIKAESGLIRRFVEISVSISVTYMIFCMCRSVIIGVTAAALLAFFGRFVCKYFFAKVTLLTSLMIVAISYLSTTNGGSLDSIRPIASFNAKTSNSSGRVVIWKNTIDMINDSKLGHGPGSFEYAFHKYNLDEKNTFSNEKTVFLSPHNEFLRIVAEEGPVFLVAVILLLGSLFSQAWYCQVGQSKYRDELRICLLYIPIFGSECLFQFPFILPVGILYGGVLLGIVFFLSKGCENRQIFIPYKKLFLISAAVLLVGHSGRKWYADYTFSNLKKDLVSSRKACGLYPNHWRVCNQQTSLEALNGNFSLARNLSDKMLARNHLFFPSIHVRFNVERMASNLSESCNYARRYDSLFYDESSLHPYITHHCLEAADSNEARNEG